MDLQQAIPAYIGFLLSVLRNVLKLINLVLLLILAVMSPTSLGLWTMTMFFFLSAANNTQGNAVSESTLRKVKVYKHDKSADTWTDLLNETTGQPQLSHAYQLDGEVTYLADNRKNFQVISHGGDTLIFYRRVQATASGVAYYNDDDDTVANVYSESHSGSEDYGLPYSMDFILDVRSDGIYVYTFVVRYEFDTSGNYFGGSLKIYRKRVEPNGTETQIFMETFVQIGDEEVYPVSVSDLILADDRSKFYFTLEWHGEGNRVGPSELCTIAKSGSGSRTVIKTYDNPLVGARSPVAGNGSYFYLEGGWVRQSKDDPLDELIPDRSAPLSKPRWAHSSRLPQTTASPITGRCGEARQSRIRLTLKTRTAFMTGGDFITRYCPI